MFSFFTDNLTRHSNDKFNIWSSFIYDQQKHVKCEMQLSFKLSYYYNLNGYMPLINLGLKWR